MPVVTMLRKEMPTVYAVRVVHPRMRGIRISLGQYDTPEEAARVDEAFARSGLVPKDVLFRFKDVWQASASKWYCSYKGQSYGPYDNGLEAAWNRRRLKDNDTQRARRAGLSGACDALARTVRTRHERTEHADTQNVRRSGRARSAPQRYSPTTFESCEDYENDAGDKSVSTVMKLEKTKVVLVEHRVAAPTSHDDDEPLVWMTPTYCEPACPY